MAIIYAIIMILEVIYYSAFMKKSKPEEQSWKYIVTFIIATIIILFLGSGNIIVYLIFTLFATLFMKYLLKMNVTFYDMMYLNIMLFVKLIIEFPLYYILKILITPAMVVIISSLIKIGLVFLLGKQLQKLYNYLKIKWDNNNFYVRYIFSIIIFIYGIVSCLFIIKYLI